MTKLKKILRRAWKIAVEGFSWIAPALGFYVLWVWFKREGCLPGEPLVTCLRQWQGLIAGGVALFIATITWKLAGANLILIKRSFLHAHYEKAGDAYENDLRLLEFFGKEFSFCHYQVERHLNNETDEIGSYYRIRLDSLKFPTWPEASTEIYYNHCLGEYKDHYSKAILQRHNKPDDFTEHGIRCHGIYGWLTKNLDDVKRRREEAYKRELDRVRK